MGTLGKVQESAPFELVPMAEYIFTLDDLTIENGQWGEQIKWVWKISPVASPRDFIVRADGEDKTLWQFTAIGLFKGYRAYEWAAALLARELEEDEEPDDDELIGKRMLAQLIHKPKKSDPKVKQERILEGSAKPYRRPRPAEDGDGQARRPRVRPPSPENAQYKPSPHAYPDDDEPPLHAYPDDELPFDK